MTILELAESLKTMNRHGATLPNLARPNPIRPEFFLGKYKR